ncbi:hypothetical protein HOY82DRAFT_540595 [Tuber indicum]|nr:hypothetical protein HOY82DRAFT_540595 [Tuber indicum]
MTTSNFPFLTTIPEIEDYQMEENKLQYKNFKNRGHTMMKNVITKFVLDKIKWWTTFSRIENGSRGHSIQQNNETVKHYNRLKDAVRGGYLEIKQVDWLGIEKYTQYTVTQRSYYISSIGAFKDNMLKSRPPPFVLSSMDIPDPSSPDLSSSQDNLNITRVTFPSYSTLNIGEISKQASFTPINAPDSLDLIPSSSTFTLQKFAQSACPDPFNLRKPWVFSNSPFSELSSALCLSEPDARISTIQQNHRALSLFQSDLELALYLKDSKMKIVKNNSRIAEEGEIVVSREEYEQLHNSQQLLSNQEQALMTENNTYRQRLKDIEEEKYNIQDKKEREKEELLHLLEDLEEMIMKS